MEKGTKKILVIDDNKADRIAIRMELESGGYRVEEAVDGFEALGRLSRPPVPDLIALDVEMPAPNGFEVCKRLADEHYGRHFGNRRPPVVFLTSNDDMECREKGFELGAADFVTKPFKPGAILETVNKVLSENRLGRGLTALVVDDSAAASKIVADCLKQEGIEVFEAKDGRHAFDMLKEMKHGVDLVVTDLLMPGMDGRELMGKIRRELNLDDVPVICLTALEERAELPRLFKAGASDYLVKPFLKEELLARINAHLDNARLAKRLSAMVEELKNLNRMKDNFLTVCSHHLRSPLTGILGFADLLLSRNNLRHDDRDALEGIKASVAALLCFVDDIIDLGKVRLPGCEPKMETVLLSETFADSIDFLRHSACAKNQEAVSDLFSRFVEVGEEIPCEKEYCLKQIADSLGFGEEKCAKYLKLYVDSARRYMVHLSEALEDGDFEKAADALHTIKGGAISMRLDSLFNLAERLEKIAKEGFVEEIRQEIHALESELRKVETISNLQ